MQVGTYFETWAMPWAAAASNDLSQIQAGINTVYLAFAQPDMTYKKGQNSFSGTGLEFSSDFQIIKSSILALQARGVKTFLSVGGGSYWSQSKQVNIQNIVDLCNDLNCDGIDIDWEVGVSDDDAPGNVIANLKSAAPSKLISFTCFSTGAFPINGDTYQGMNLLAISRQSKNIDQINVMAYDAGASFDAVAAFKAYRAIYTGHINIGFEIGTQGWGNALLTLTQLQTVSKTVSSDPQSGCFFWAYYSKANSPAVDRQTAVSAAVAIFTKTTTPLPPPPTAPLPPPPTAPLPAPPTKPTYSVPSSVLILCPNCKHKIKSAWYDGEA